MSIDKYSDQSDNQMRVPSWRVDDIDHAGSVPLPPSFDLIPGSRAEAHAVHEARRAYQQDLQRGIVHLEGLWDADDAATNHVEAVSVARELRKKTTALLAETATRPVVLSPKKVFEIVTYKPRHTKGSEN